MDLKIVLERSGLHASPKQRPSASQLLKHSVFKTPYSYIVSFLSDYVLKSDAERYKFFNEFPKLAKEISEEVLCSSIFPLFLVPAVFTDFPAKGVIGHLLTPLREGSSFGLISESTFTRLVVPQISRLFRCHELTTRMLILQHFQSYARLMGRETLKTIVLPEVCMGVFDANEDLAAASLSGLGHLARLLGTGLVMSHFQSLGAQMESRSFLTPAPLSDMDKANLSFYTTLATAPSKKPLVYTPSKRPWRRTRTSFFPDSAPKSNRQAREPPAEKPIQNGNVSGKTGKLADMAMLSANYIPMAAPVKRIPNVGPPIVKKISSIKPVQNPRPSSSINLQTPEKEKNDPAELVLSDDVTTAVSAVNAVKALESPPSSIKSNSVQSNASSPPVHSPVVVTPNIADDGDDQWNDWSSDGEDESKKLADKMNTFSTTSPQPSEFPSEEEEMKKREETVEALLAELEPKIAPGPSITSLPRSTTDSGYLALNSGPLTPTSSNLQYKVERLSADLNSIKVEDEDEADGWDVDDEYF